MTRPMIDLDERTPIEADELTDRQYELVEALEPMLEATPGGLTPSAAARRVRATTAEILPVLGWMIEHRYAHTTGNGAWRRYHAGKAA